VKRAAIATVIALAGSCSPAAIAVARHPHAELTRYACRLAQNPQHREIALTAVMRHIGGTAHMAIEFSLFREAAGSSSFHHLHVGGLDQWISPRDPTLGQRNGDVWKLDKVVSDLAGPAVYRLKATFRWTDAHHRVLLHTSRETPVCRAD
jgi:hypothetical protein